MNIEVRKATAQEVATLGAKNWPIWECDVSTFDWQYDDRETCLILEGQVTVEGDGQKATFGAGDIVVFPKGLSCTWKISKAVRKHYKFG